MHATRLRLLALGTVALCFAQPGLAAGPLTFTGICEPSGAVALPGAVLPDAFLVANDEDNTLRVYRASEGGAPLATFDLNEVIEPTPRREFDLEGATWLDGKVLWIGSHSRNGDGERRKDRRQFFATTVAAGEAPVVAVDPPVSLHDLAEVVSGLDPALRDTIRLDVEEDADLAPDNGGFNIEGLTAAADGASVLVGLRSPQTAAGEAIIIRFPNPADALAGEAPRLGPVVPLNLGGRGIRSIELVPSLGTYLIVAGPVGGAAPFALYSWSGKRGEDPVEIPSFATALTEFADFTPEAMIPSPDGTQVLVLSDDGDRCPDPQSFRGARIDID